MYKVITQEELKKKNVYKDYKIYKLCYINEIPETYSDYTPEAKKIMESDEYKKWYQEYKEYRDKELAETGWSTFSWNDCPWNDKLEFKEYNNPERELGTHYAYFTPVDLDKQWGDDWNDAPYEYNAGGPYDQDDNLKEYTIIKVPFTVNENCVFPKDYSYNSPFSIQDINNKAVAWMYNGKKAIHAGINPFDFIKEIKDF